MKVRTRMAPSPTGELHIGGLRTALYDYAWAKKHNGQFVLRIEDTDRERLVEGALDRILDTLLEFNLRWDEGPRFDGPYRPYVQSERADLYREHVQILIKKGYAYYCFCSKKRLENLRKQQQAEKKLPRYDRLCRTLSPDDISRKLQNNEPYVIRMKIPDNEEIVFEDLARGEIRTNSSVLDDQVLLKSDGLPTYHLAVVVDDHLMDITHVIRGNEWISSTPKHILLYRFFEWEIPKFIHLSVFLDPEGEGKMSKRKGSVHARAFLGQGYLAEALLNYLMLLGWNPQSEREMFTLSEFIDAFDLAKINISNQKFTYEKLNWFNQQYIRALDDVTLAQRLKNFSSREEREIVKVLPLVKERMVTLKDFDELTSYMFEVPKIPTEMFQKYPSINSVLEHSISVLNDNWDGNVLEKEAREFCRVKSVKVGDYFMVLRVAITGRSQTPPLWEVMEILGREETLNRLGAVAMAS